MKSNEFLGFLKTKGKNIQWLEARMKEEGVEITRSTIYKKLRGESEFNAPEIKTISKVMEFTNDQMLDIFFDELVS